MKFKRKGHEKSRGFLIFARRKPTIIIETMKKVSIFAVATTLLLAACAEKPGYEIAGTVAKADVEGQYVYLQK